MQGWRSGRVPCWQEGGYGRAEAMSHRCVQVQGGSQMWDGLPRQRPAQSPGVPYIITRLPRLPSPLVRRGRILN